MADRISFKRVLKPLVAWKERCIQIFIPPIVNALLVKPFLRLGTHSIEAEKTAHSIECIGKVVKKFQEGYSVIIVPSHPMARRHTLGMMYHCMKISEQISGENPHVVLATDEVTFMYIKFGSFNKILQRMYWAIGHLGGHIMLNRYDPNSSFRAGIDIARLLRNQSIVVMAGEGYPRHDSRKYVDIPNVVESFYTKLKNKNILSPSVNKDHFVSELAREIQELIDREDKTAYRSGKLSDHIIASIRQLLLGKIPDGYIVDVDDIIDELLMTWGERFGNLRGIDPVLGVTVQPRHKALILPVVFTEYSDKHLHIDVRDFFLIDGVSYTEVRANLRDIEKIQRCNAAMDMLDESQHLRIIHDICEFAGIIYELSDHVFEEYHTGKFPFQELWDTLEERFKSPQDKVEQQHIEAYRNYLLNFKIAAEIATLNEDDRTLLLETIKLNMGDLEQVIPSIRIRQAWKRQDIK